MKAIPFLRPNTALPRKTSLCLQLGVLLFLAFVFAGTAFAKENTETRITTLLPSSTETLIGKEGPKVAPADYLKVSDKFAQSKERILSYLEFSVESLPDDATITKAVLRLVQKGAQPNSNTLVMKVASVPRANWSKLLSTFERKRNSFVQATIRSSSTDANAADTADIEAPKPMPVQDEATPAPGFLRIDQNGKKYIALLLLPQKSRSGRNYYPFTGDTKGSASNQPRLILTYTVPRSTIPRSPDAQSDGWAAIRSPRAFIPKSNVPRQEHYTVMPVVDGMKISSYTSATFGGLTYVVQKYADKQNNEFDLHLDALEPLGGVVWPMKLPSSPFADDKVRIVVNESGRLTISGKDRTSEKNRFIVYQLNTDEPRKPPETHLKNKPVDGVKSPKALLPGPDGSLYVIGDTDILALNHDLKLLWRTDVGTSESARMTLSPDGQFVYVVSKTKGLLAINAQTGKPTAMSDFPSQTKSFHSPVVIRHPDGADYIYIAAHSQNNGVLRTVKNMAKGEDGDREAVLSMVHEETGFFSQPAPDKTGPKDDLSAKKLWVVWKENQSSPVRLVSINAQSGEIENRTAPPIKDAQRNNASFEDTSWLWRGGNLAMDTNGNVVFWENGRLFGYEADSKKIFHDRFDNRPEKWQRLWTKLELLFGADGTLYAQNSKTGALSALIPSYKLPTSKEGISCPPPPGVNGTVDKDTTLKECISSPTHLRVNGTVANDTTLSARGSVILGKGFTVEQGATLAIATGTP